MGWWKELPYRGSGEPKGSKPRRQFRNLKKEKQENILTVFGLLILLGLLFSCLAFAPGINDAHKSATKIVAIPFIIAFLAAIISAIKSINKFRKGYDVDISDEAEKEKDNRSEDSND
jgi:choline-glycine betaine transporter